MRNIILLLTLYTAMASSSLGQKRIIDTNACENWVSLQNVDEENMLITNNGEYCVYSYGRNVDDQKTCIKGLSNSFSIELKNAQRSTLSNDSKYFLALLPKDTLIVLNLFTHEKMLIPDIESFEIAAEGNFRWLKYRLVSEPRTVILKKIDSKEQYIYRNIDESILSRDGDEILLKDTSGLTLVKLNSNQHIKVPQSSNTKKAVLDASGRQIAFLTDDVLGNTSVKYFKIGTTVSRILVDKKNVDSSNNMRISDNILNFTPNGQRIYFSYKYLHQGISAMPNRSTVWSYNDKIVRPKQLVNRNSLNDKAYYAVVSINTNDILLLENDELELAEDVSQNNDFALLKSKINENEYYWNNQSQILYFVSFELHKKTRLTELKYPGFQRPSLIQKERFAVWFDSKEAKYFSFDTRSNTTYDICRQIPNKLSISERGEADKIRERKHPYGLQETNKEDNNVFIYDSYDIWKVDLLGNKEPVNVTRSLGKANDIRFRIVSNKKRPVFYRQEMILLYAFNMRTKENGFWEVSASSKIAPKKLVMDANIYYFQPTSLLVPANSAEDASQFQPIRAKNKQAFIIRRMNTKESPNLYFTKDFHSFIKISNIHPEDAYIWPESELITWTLPDGLKCSGILYRQQGFDSSKKYPVIFNYYERRSENLNGYRTPELIGHNINVPWFVSRGYLVFEPDFYYKTGDVATNIINTINSSIKRLESVPYVDTKRLGAQGQSFGGYETNVIITGTTLFKAACEMAGPTNIVSEYNSLRPNGDNNQTSADNGQRNIGAFPWEEPERFIKNSPVFQIGNIETPLLIVHNQDDGAINYNQALELFLGMRRANKKVWLIEYEGEGHTISNPENQFDLTIRIQQFFDYYLKDSLPPIWMTSNALLPHASYLSGLEFDSSGVIP